MKFLCVTLLILFSFTETTSASGTQPVITMESFDTSGGINLMCQSRGWNNEPAVVWTDKKGAVLPAKDIQIQRDIEGFSVKTHIMVHDHGDSNRFYCRIQQKQHELQTEIIITSKVFSIWKVAVAISVLAFVIVVGLIVLMILYVRLMKELQRVKQEAAEQKKNLEEELQREKQNAAEQKKILEEALQREIQNAAEQKRIIEDLGRKAGDIEYLKKYAVDVILDRNRADPILSMSADGKEVKYGDIRENQPGSLWFDFPFALGNPGFSSGRFYYEVRVSGKTMWGLGVVRESIIGKHGIRTNPQGGFWTVGLKNGNEYWAWADPDVRLKVKRMVEKLGVFVDYEEGLVSFYDAETKSHIYSYTHQSFNDKICPYFNPCENDGGRNATPLIISPVNPR